MQCSLSARKKRMAGGAGAAIDTGGSNSVRGTDSLHDLIDPSRTTVRRRNAARRHSMPAI